MGWARIAVVNEDWSPLKRIDVECFDIDTGVPITVVTTDLGGIALFTGLPGDQRYFFKPRVRRVSTKVGDRTYTGQVRIQILAASAYCFTALVDPTGQWGSHKTIQAAMDDASVTGINHIGIYPGNYDEALAITDSKHYWLEACGRPYTGEFSTMIPPISGGTIAVSIRAYVLGNDPALDYDGSGSFVAQGIYFGANTTTGVITTREIGTLRLIHCQIAQSGAGGGLVGDLTSGTPRGVELRHVRVYLDDDSQLAVNLLYSPYLIEKCELLGGVLLGRTGSLVRGIIRDCHIQGAASPLVALASLQDGYITVSGCYLGLKAAVDGIVVTDTVGGSSAIRCIISGNTFEGFSAIGTTAVDVSSIACTGGALVNSNYFERFAVGVALGTNGLAWGNYYTNVTTDVTGTNNVSPTEVSTSTAFNHDLLDGTIHTDTVAQAVTAGSLIFGNDTPAWDELAIAVPAANVRNVLGIDNGETTPSWKTALDGTNPADIAAAASPGTSLPFAHRDHVHAHPVFASGDLHTDYALDSDLTTHAGIAAAHHAVYLDADAIAAIEGEATLALDGAITEIHGDANFTLSIVSANPRLTVDAGDYLEYNRAGNYFSVVAAATESLQIGATYLRAAGYARVGSIATPVNVTAGDVTLGRLMIAEDAAFGTDYAYFLYCGGTLTDTAGGVQSRAFMLYPTIDPPSNSSASFRSLHLSARLDHGASTLTEVILGHLAGTVLGAANVAIYKGVNTVLQATSDSAATLSLGTVTSFSAQLLARTGTPTITATTVVAYEIYGAPGNGIAGDSWGTIIGLRIPNLGGTRTTNAYGIQLTGQSGATGDNIGLWFSTDVTNQGGGIAWGASKDTNLYRSAVDVLKTDDSFVVGVGLSVTTKSLLGLHTLTANSQADVILFSNAAGDGAQSGAYYNKLIIYGGGSQTRYLALYRAVSGDAYIDAWFANLHLRTTSGDANILLEPSGAGIVQITSELQLDGDFNHDGSNVGFYGTAPIAQQAGVAVSAAAIHAALVALGLITA